MNAVIATTPQGMIAAQPKLLEWCEIRLNSAKQDLSLAESTFNALQRGKMRTNAASSQIRKARQRITFYEKVRAAIELGYYIVPPFDLQVFAIRTDRSPLLEHGERAWGRDQNARRLPIGEGEYKDPNPGRYEVATVTKKNYDGKDYEVKIFENGDDFKDVELPLRAQKPEIIEAVSGALEAKIFDALGIAPAYRAADPIICGRIFPPEKNRAPLTFFVAWWFDQGDL